MCWSLCVQNGSENFRSLRSYREKCCMGHKEIRHSYVEYHRTPWLYYIIKKQMKSAFFECEYSKAGTLWKKLLRYVANALKFLCTKFGMKMFAAEELLRKMFVWGIWKTRSFYVDTTGLSCLCPSSNRWDVGRITWFANPIIAIIAFTMTTLAMT